MKPALNPLWLSLALILAACGKGDDKKPAGAASTTQAAAQTPPAAKPGPAPRGPGDTAPPPGASMLLPRYDLLADMKELKHKVDAYGRAVHAFDARPNRRTAAHAIAENK